MDIFGTLKEIRQHRIKCHTKINVNKIKKVKLCHPCDICGKIFRNKMELKYHERTHDNVRLFKCKYCDKRFIHPSTRMKHINDVHLQLKPFQCKICKKKFKRKECLQKHKQTHLNMNERTLYPCNICHKKFANKSNLKRHQKNIHLI